MKNIFSAIAASTLLLSGAMANAQGVLTPIPPINDIVAFEDTPETLRICTGAAGRPYHNKAVLMSGAIANATGLHTTALAAGGTVDCLNKLAQGEAELAVIQLDGAVWAEQVSPALSSVLGRSEQILTEPVLAFCSRDSGAENLRSVARTRGKVIAVAGGEHSGTNLFFNVMSAVDKNFLKATYRYTDGWDAAMTEVVNGFAECAVGIQSLTSASSFAELDRKYSSRLRMVRFWDSDIRRVKYGSGEQVYNWLYVPEENRDLGGFLDWRGNNQGRGTWSPDTVTVNAMVVYRKDLNIPNFNSAVNTAANAVATLDRTEK